ncbi:MAG: pyruvate:ferredoxin (flavodoxin) oxidoreductase [Balneolaceae bacterium]|nr:pyruvate:ferredoxin (flavodoxin) oxidoreductase [Balneolaceae bacterium]MBO6546784.1 pyruvate:ferredoxin (flavodoxin) oxidoreductase [Balneolaceae bacterium]MBO6649144.1 pyruvate:ferredoxin (flavodoxin) oxidoreductase [Balneolaceae bacterium]
MKRVIRTMDGNEAAAHVAFKTNEVIAIYPITPASPMGEWTDAWAVKKKKNLWGDVPKIIEMQSEGGAAGTVHGSLQSGSLTTTFTASQGLLLMLPNMYKIAGELTPTVFHIAARSLATQALSIFGDHSDVMAVRSAGWGMLFANNVQEVMDFSLISQAATLSSRIPFLHIFDGFRTSHEIAKIEVLSDSVIKKMINPEMVKAHRDRGMNPNKPFIRGTAQNPDVFFQARETTNSFYNDAPLKVDSLMQEFEKLTGRSYHLFDYAGAPDAERVIIIMGSGADTVSQTVEYLSKQGEKVGVLKVRLFRPFSVKYMIESLPETVRSIAVLDRTKEPGALGEPLYQDVITALIEDQTSETPKFDRIPIITGGRYGLSSKEFTPAMVKSVFEELETDTPKNHFTIGINDDVTNTSLDFDPEFDIETKDTTRAVFWGLGSDGTVGANKNSIKIIGEETELNAQGYFVYDSKKSGARTISHLRFGKGEVKRPYLIRNANFVGVHQFGFLQRYDTLEMAADRATVLLNSPFPADQVWKKLPKKVQQQIHEKNLKLFVIDGYEVAKKAGLGIRINTVMQTCFFAISGVLPKRQAIDKIKEYIEKTYGKRGKTIVSMNFHAVDMSLENLYEVNIPDEAKSRITTGTKFSKESPEFVQKVIAEIINGQGDNLPVSALPCDGTYPTGTTKWEKRDIAMDIPVWNPDICIQCGKCVVACPHSVIRAKVVEPAALETAPNEFKHTKARFKEFKEQEYTLQVSVDDCTGCSICVEVCPVKDKSNVSRKALNMEPKLPVQKNERENWDFFIDLPSAKVKDHPEIEFNKIKETQLLDPYFEFSGACAGCGETPYLSLLTRLFGDRMIVANATGCSSIYGGNLPTTPWCTDKEGKGPAWNNSLFEDNAEFGLGMRLAVDKKRETAHNLLKQMRGKEIPESLAEDLIHADQSTEQGIQEQQKRVDELLKRLSGKATAPSRRLEEFADALVRKSVWIIGGDGWAYDIGFGGLDHVLASGENVNVLVMDTEVYSNTGGQASKATGLGAIAKFAAGGKPTPKKDLGSIMMNYGYVYVAQVAMGANENQVIKAFKEAESYEGPSIIIAYSHCIAHGIDMSKGMDQQKLATDSGYWPIYRYDPRIRKENKNPLQLDSKPPKLPLADYIYNEQRYKLLTQTNPGKSRQYLEEAQNWVTAHWKGLEELAEEPEAPSTETE